MKKLETRSFYFSVYVSLLIHLTFMGIFLIGIKLWEISVARETLIEIDLEKFLVKEFQKPKKEDPSLPFKKEKSVRNFKTYEEKLAKEFPNLEDKSLEKEISKTYEKDLVKNEEEKAKEETLTRASFRVEGVGREIGLGAETKNIGKAQFKGFEGDKESLPKLEKDFLEQKFGIISDIVRKHLKYPYIARKMGWEGKVVVSFVLTKEGKIKEVKIEKSSGYQILDENTVSTLYFCAKYFPVPPIDVKIKLPVVYKLD